MKVYKSYPGKGVQWGFTLLLVILAAMIVPLRIMVKSGSNLWASLPFGILII